MNGISRRVVQLPVEVILTSYSGHGQTDVAGIGRHAMRLPEEGTFRFCCGREPTGATGLGEVSGKFRRYLVYRDGSLLYLCGIPLSS